MILKTVGPHTAVCYLKFAIGEGIGADMREEDAQPAVGLESLAEEHAPSRAFTHREFAFTLPGDVYLRYNSFNNAEDLKRQVVRLNPSRFEIGAVYNARVSLTVLC